MRSEYLTVADLSAYLKRSPGSIRNLVLRRKIPFRKAGGRLTFVQEEIDQWVQKSPGISLKEMETQSDGN